MTNQPSPLDYFTNEWRKSNILIVDDEPMILDQLEQDLCFEPFELYRANSAEEALDLIRKRHIHVILCDQKMPNGMYGTELLYEARLLRPYIVGIILSAYSEPEYLMDAINKARVFAYLVKPWNKKELIECLKKAQQMSYLSRIENGDKRIFDLNLYEQYQHQHEELEYTQNMLKQAVSELNDTQKALRESNRENGKTNANAGLNLKLAED
ncbi:MAG: response regulator [Deltaproteobacteria bacterium]|nr:response regulator [Deltaproteobacteria bacterium]